MPPRITKNQAWVNLKNAQDALEKPTRCFERPEIWEQESTQGRARMLCAGCPLIEQCLTYAKADKYAEGTWGGRYFAPRITEEE